MADLVFVPIKPCPVLLVNHPPFFYWLPAITVVTPVLTMASCPEYVYQNNQMLFLFCYFNFILFDLYKILMFCFNNAVSCLKYFSRYLCFKYLGPPTPVLTYQCSKWRNRLRTNQQVTINKWTSGLALRSLYCIFTLDQLIYDYEFLSFSQLRSRYDMSVSVKWQNLQLQHLSVSIALWH